MEDIKKFIKEKKFFSGKKPLKRYLFIFCGETDHAAEVFDLEIQSQFGVKKTNTINLDLDKVIITEQLFDKIDTEDDFEEFRKKTYWQLVQVAERAINEGYHITWGNALLSKTLKVIECTQLSIC